MTTSLSTIQIFYKPASALTQLDTVGLALAQKKFSCVMVFCGSVQCFDHGVWRLESFRNISLVGKWLLRK